MKEHEIRLNLDAALSRLRPCKRLLCLHGIGQGFVPCLTNVATPPRKKSGD